MAQLDRDRITSGSCNATQHNLIGVPNSVFFSAAGSRSQPSNNLRNLDERKIMSLLLFSSSFLHLMLQKAVAQEDNHVFQ